MLLSLYTERRLSDFQFLLGNHIVSSVYGKLYLFKNTNRIIYLNDNCKNN